MTVRQLNNNVQHNILCLVVVQVVRSTETPHLHIFVFQTVTEATENRKVEEVHLDVFENWTSPDGKLKPRTIARKKKATKVAEVESLVASESACHTRRSVWRRQSCYEQDDSGLCQNGRPLLPCTLSFLSFPRLVSFCIKRSSHFILYIGRYFSSRDFLLHQVFNDHFRFLAAPLKIVHEIGYMFFFRLRVCIRWNAFGPSPPAFASVALPMKLLSSI